MKIGFEAKRVFHNTTGLGNYSRDLIRILSLFYPKNEYFLYNPKPSKKTLFETDEKIVFEKRPQGFFNKTFPNFWRQSSIVNDLGQDGIQLFHGLSGEIPAGLKKKGIKSIVTIHDLIFKRYPQFFSFIDRNIYFRKFKHAAHAADLIIAISEQTKSDIIHYLGIAESKIKVIYQGCHAAFKKNYTAEEKEALIKKYNLPPSFLLNVGTIEPRKNILTAVKAIKDIDTHLVIVGRETPYTQEVKTYIAHNQLENKVSFLKGLSIDELAILYQLADIFIYPSLFEGFGIPIIEALFSKTPVITGKGSCFAEAGGPSTVYIKQDQITEIAQAIQTLLADQGLRTQMAENGLKYAQQFQDEVIAKEIMKTYQSLLSPI